MSQQRRQVRGLRLFWAWLRAETRAGGPLPAPAADRAAIEAYVTAQTIGLPCLRCDDVNDCLSHDTASHDTWAAG